MRPSVSIRRLHLVTFYLLFIYRLSGRSGPDCHRMSLDRTTIIIEKNISNTVNRGRDGNHLCFVFIDFARLPILGCLTLNLAYLLSSIFALLEVENPFFSILSCFFFCETLTFNPLNHEKFLVFFACHICTHCRVIFHYDVKSCTSM